MPVPDSDVRLEGIREQLERAKLFLAEAQRSPDRLDRFRRLIACMYFSRAIVEIMLVAAEMDVVPCSRQELEDQLVPILPRYDLVEALRIHDFHRFGVLERPGMFMGGIINLRASRGVAAIYMDDGPKKVETGESKVIEQRALHFEDGAVYDQDANAYVSLETILVDYLAAVPRAIEMFQRL